jgi:germacradienol/geosmin synthase
MRQFEHTVATELPALFDEFGLGTSVREQLLKLVKALQDWMAGELKWTLATGRFKNPTLNNSLTAARLLSGPNGLGASAARIRSLRAAGSPDRY